MIERSPLTEKKEGDVLLEKKHSDWMTKATDKLKSATGKLNIVVGPANLAQLGIRALGHLQSGTGPDVIDLALLASGVYATIAGARTAKQAYNRYKKEMEAEPEIEVNGELISPPEVT